MKQGTNRKRSSELLAHLGLMLRELAKGRRLDPKLAPAFRALWRRVIPANILLYVSLVIQACLALLVWQLIQLCIELFEAWVILARHSMFL